MISLSINRASDSLDFIYSSALWTITLLEYFLPLQPNQLLTGCLAAGSLNLLVELCHNRVNVRHP